MWTFARPIVAERTCPRGLETTSFSAMASERSDPNDKRAQLEQRLAEVQKEYREVADRGWGVNMGPFSRS